MARARSLLQHRGRSPIALGVEEKEKGKMMMMMMRYKGGKFPAPLV